MIRGMLSAYSKRRQLYLLHLNFKTKRVLKEFRGLETDRECTFLY